VSSAPVATKPAARQATRQGGWRLGNRLRKTVLLLHIVAGGTWFGLDVAMAVLVITAIGTDSAAVRAHTLQSLQLITVWPMFSSAMLSLITGILLGLGSKYGLVRYWWVAIKLVLNLLLAILVVTALRGEVVNAASLGAQLAGGADVEWNFTNMIYPPIVSPTALTIAFLLAVFKPWGRIRRRASTSSGG
jgi:uncharacterized membrane protein